MNGMNPGSHWFWWGLVLACLVWYSTVTVYVAFKGVFDIKDMLARLGTKASPSEKTEEKP